MLLLSSINKVVARPTGDRIAAWTDHSGVISQDFRVDESRGAERDAALLACAVHPKIRRNPVLFDSLLERLS